MNERIRELAEQATDCEEYDGFRYFNKAKFAELIVEECLLKINGAKIRNESYTELIERMWRMIQLELAVESAHQLLMQAYHATGNQEMVRRVYHSCEHLVQHHMGIGVAAETTRLYRRVMSS